ERTGPSGTRRESIHGGSSSPSMAPTVPGGPAHSAATTQAHRPASTRSERATARGGFGGTTATRGIASIGGRAQRGPRCELLLRESPATVRRNQSRRTRYLRLARGWAAS